MRGISIIVWIILGLAAAVVVFYVIAKIIVPLGTGSEGWLSLLP